MNHIKKVVVILLLCGTSVSLYTMNQERTVEKSSSTCLSENHSQKINEILKTKKIDFFDAMKQIRSLGETDQDLQRALGNKDSAFSVIDYVDSHCNNEAATLELIAIGIATPGTLNWAKDYVTTKPKAQKRLTTILINIGQLQGSHIDLARAILAVGISPDATDQGNILQDNVGSTALVNATRYGKIDLVSLLLAHGADIEKKSPSDSRTPLMEASLYGYTDIVRFLLSKRANVNAKNDRDETSLIWASAHAHVDTVEALLHAENVEVNCRDQDGNTALKESKEEFFSQQSEKYKKIVQLLENAGAKE